MQAIILAGGRGTRLFPVTIVTPKPLIMIRGRPVIRYVIDRIVRAGISNVVICTSDRHTEDFRNALGDGDNGVSISYSEAPEDTATSGRILRSRKLMDGEDFLIYYADILTNLSIGDLLALHRATKETTLCTLAVTDNKTLEFGVVKTELNGHRVETFLEKPSIGQVSSYKANIGIAACRTQILNFCGDELDFFGDVVPSLIRSGYQVAYKSFQDPFADIGTFAALEKAAQLVEVEA